MGIRFYCPNGHKLHVKSFLAGKKGICPYCGAITKIPLQSTRPSSRALRRQKKAEPLTDTAHSAVGVPDLEPPGTDPARKAHQGGKDVVESAPQAGEVFTPSEPTGSTAKDLDTPSRATPRFAAPAGSAPASTPERRVPGPSKPISVFSPLEEDPAAEWYVMPPQGGRYGPARAAVMHTWLMEGRIGLDTLVWRTGWPEWKRAEEVFPNLQKFLDSLEQRLTPAHPPSTSSPSSWSSSGAFAVLPTGGATAGSQERSDRRGPLLRRQFEAPTAGSEGGGYMIPIVVAVVLGGVSIAAVILVLLARGIGS